MKYNLKRAVLANIAFIWVFSFFLSWTAYINGGVSYGLKSIVASCGAALIATLCYQLPISLRTKSMLIIYLPFFSAIGLSIISGGVSRMFGIYHIVLAMQALYFDYKRMLKVGASVSGILILLYIINPNFLMDSGQGLGEFIPRIGALIAVSFVLTLLSKWGEETVKSEKEEANKNYLAQFDLLTQAYNRRAGIAKLTNLLSSCELNSHLVSLCFLDINSLKHVNDTLGHKFGDELIVTVAEIIMDTIAETDFLIRLGGDEFLIVFQGINRDKAEETWVQIIQTYSIINDNEDRPYLISVSHGIIEFNHITHPIVDDLINAADEKMYAEKQLMKTGLSVIKRKFEF